MAYPSGTWHNSGQGSVHCSRLISCSWQCNGLVWVSQCQCPSPWICHRRIIITPVREKHKYSYIFWTTVYSEIFIPLYSLIISQYCKFPYKYHEIMQKLCCKYDFLQWLNYMVYFCTNTNCSQLNKKIMCSLDIHNLKKTDLTLLSRSGNPTPI